MEPPDALDSFALTPAHPRLRGLGPNDPIDWARQSMRLEQEAHIRWTNIIETSELHQTCALLSHPFLHKINESAPPTAPTYIAQFTHDIFVETNAVGLPHV